MAAINVDPLPPRSGFGIGAYQEFIEQLDAMIAMLEENTESDDSHDSSSDSLEVQNLFDPDVHTVTEFRNAILAIRNAISDVV